jgi:hypothetical protein
LQNAINVMILAVLETGTLLILEIDSQTNYTLPYVHVCYVLLSA